MRRYSCNRAREIMIGSTPDCLSSCASTRARYNMIDNNSDCLSSCAFTPTHSLVIAAVPTAAYTNSTPRAGTVIRRTVQPPVSASAVYS